MTIGPPKAVLEITSGNTRTPIGLTLTQSGAAVPLSGLTVTYKLIDADGESVIAETSSNLVIVDADAGEIAINLQAGGALPAGEYFLFVNVYEGEAYDTFPHKERRLAVLVAPNEPVA